MHQVREVEESNDASGLLTPIAVAEAARLESWLVENDHADPTVCFVLGWIHWLRTSLTPEGEREPEVRRALELLVSCYEDGVQGLPEPLLPYLANGAEPVAIEQFRRVLTDDDPGLLEHTAALLQRIVDDTPPGHPHQASRLSLLAGVLRTRAMRAGPDADDSDLDTATDLLTAATAARDDAAQDPGDLFNLSQILITRYHRRKDRGDLDRAIGKLREVLVLVPASPTYLAMLGHALRDRYTEDSHPADLSDALDCLRTADRLAPPDHRERGHIHAGLGAALHARAAWTNRIGDLDEALAQYDLALRHTPEGHADRSQYTAWRAATQRERDTGRTSRDVLRRMTEAVPPVPGPIPGHEEHDPVDTLAALGGLCRLRGKADLGEPQWLDLAIAYYRAAIASAGPDHPKRADVLTLLGAAYGARSLRGASDSPASGSNAQETA
ncbi:hypothetical protein ACFW2Y_28005 [Streptomyces sp. NPDC058877]|uniref:hypothetical protein n=1 Tax=unclassified Streptomyces TaxID=2593676 RepID=UPI0036B8604E